MTNTKLMFNGMDWLITLKSDTLSHGSPPVIGYVINFLQPGKFSVCKQHKIHDMNAQQFV